MIGHSFRLARDDERLGMPTAGQAAVVRSERGSRIGPFTTAGASAMVAANDTRTRQMPSAFGHLLKRLRAAADLTQEELAERAGVSARLISDLERGSIHRPRRDTVQLLAGGLRLTGSERDAFCALARGRLAAGVEHLAADAVVPRSNVPAPPNPIVGRLKETAATTAMVMQPETRLLSLVGPGGVGKTRLAIEVASRAAAAFPDGITFVDLAPIRDPALVVPAIARAREIKIDGDQSLRDQLISSLASGRALIVLDNVEHLAAAATDVADLLAACPGLTILTTSRASLHIRAELEYHVEPLVTPHLQQLPPPSELARIPAVDLFLRRAEAANRSFALTEGNARAVAEIVVRLDGLPLAIELAAARVKILPPANLLARLEHRLPLLTGGARDLPVRLQAIRTTIAWSYDLLNPPEQQLFRRVSVFAGGCSLDAAEAVGSGTFAPSGSVLDVITALVDQNLMRVSVDEQDGPRFGMLETIREYGLESLAAAGEEAEARRLHAAWCLAFAGQAEAELSGPAQDHWYARLEIEHDNLRAALGWAIDRGDTAMAMRLSSSLWRFWDTRGYYVEGRTWLERALTLRGDVDSGTKAKAAGGAGVMAARQCDHAQAAHYFLQAQGLYRQAGDQSGLAGSLNDLAIVLCTQDDYERARALHEEALALYRTLGHQVQIARVLGNLGMLAQDLKEYDRAAQLHEESLAIRRAVGDLNGVAGALVGLALVAHAQGRFDEAAKLQEEALGLFRSLGNQVFIAEGFENLAIIAEAQHRPERAMRLFGAAEALRNRIGAPYPPYRQELCERGIAGARAQLADLEPTRPWNSGFAMPIDEALAYALQEVGV